MLGGSLCRSPRENTAVDNKYDQVATNIPSCILSIVGPGTLSRGSASGDRRRFDGLPQMRVIMNMAAMISAIGSAYRRCLLRALRIEVERLCCLTADRA